MPLPTAAFSVSVRVRFDNKPGALGRLAAAIGEVGGNIVAFEGFEARGEFLDEDLIVNCSSEEHIRRWSGRSATWRASRCCRVSDRTFDMHHGRQDRGAPARMPVSDRDDLSMAYTPGCGPGVHRRSHERPELAHDATRSSKNTVAIVTDGTAVLGLGDIGPDAAPCR
ncbi:MAG: hypothetical protein V9E94_04740 [Microthrixaceae bacterium]